MTFKIIKNKATEKAIEDLPDKAVYETARQILDLTYPTIPMSKPSGMNFGVKTGHTSGYLRRSTMKAGVKGSNRDYYIESTAEYADIVYNYPDNKTNWSTPGTHAQWFHRIWNKQGKAIFDRVCERYKI